MHTMCTLKLALFEASDQCPQLVHHTFLAKRLHSSLILLLQSLQKHALDGF